LIISIRSVTVVSPGSNIDTHSRVTYKLELMHGHLCGTVTPETPGSKYFFLLFDDCWHS
jgi:hypothetical protein